MPESYVLDPPPASPGEAKLYFLARLAAECDSWDVFEDQKKRRTGFVVIDARTAAAYADRHIPGAILLPSRSIDAASVAELKGQVAVVYGWGPGCNAGTKAAARLAELGIPVKELLGGLEAWMKNGYPTEGGLARDVPFEANLAWHHQGEDRQAQYR